MRQLAIASCTLGLLAACAAGDGFVEHIDVADAIAREAGSADEGVPLPDPESWQAWWACNQQAFLGNPLSISVHAPPDEGRDVGAVSPPIVSLMPTEAAIRADILPALRRTLDQTRDPALATACMVAMARSRLDAVPDFDLFELLKARIASPVPALRHIAVLSIGIAARPDEPEVSLLLDLLRDRPEGRTACGTENVDAETRRCAAVGLGLIARAARPEASPQLRRSIDGLGEVLLFDQPFDPRLRAVAIAGLGRLGVAPANDDCKQLYRDGIAALRSFYLADLPQQDRRLQALCAPAIARLVIALGDPTLRGEYQQLFAADLEAGSVRCSPWLSQSAAIALGQLCHGDEGDAGTARREANCCRILLDTWHRAADAPTRHFAVMALGQIGGKTNRAELLQEFEAARDARDQAWLALALGELRAQSWQRAMRLGLGPDADPELGRALLGALASATDPDCQAAIALALAIGNCRDHGDACLQLLRQRAVAADLAGCLAVGLGLLGVDAARPDLRALVASPSTDAPLLQQAAIGLALLQDKELVRLLLERADRCGPAGLRATIALLGRVGDREAVVPLLARLENAHLPASVRAAAASALGELSACEPGLLGARLCIGMNYLAAPSPLR